MSGLSSWPAFGVLPTVVLVGPAAVLAALCPAACAALALVWRRWAFLLGAAGLISSLYLAHVWWVAGAVATWWGSARALWAVAAAVALGGAWLSRRRARAAARAGRAADLTPGRLARVLLPAAATAGLAAVLYALHAGALWRWPWREALPPTAAAVAGAVALHAARAACATEAVTLLGLAAGCALASAAGPPSAAPEVVWAFEAPEQGVIDSTPLVAGERVYVSAAHVRGSRPVGAVYCLERATSKVVWQFDRGGRMKQVLSSPALDAGRLYVGEGLHEDAACRLYCLDGATGRELWSFATGSHTESSPRVAGGRVFFGAGDDGVYCLESASGALRWQFPGLHVDTTPAVLGERLYAGSAGGDAECFCLDTATGRPVWRTPSGLTVFGVSAAAGQVFFSVGNGKLNRAAEEPAGALVCLDAATGRELWRHDTRDAVLSAATVTADRVYFGARDRHCYCLHRRDGRVCWQRDVGSPVVGGVVLAGQRLHAVGQDGALVSLEAVSGKLLSRFDLGRRAHATSEVLASPALAFDGQGQGARPRLYVGAGLRSPLRSVAILYCVQLPGGE
jgi:outer membrane protein assembly factor BamB